MYIITFFNGKRSQKQKPLAIRHVERHDLKRRTYAQTSVSKHVEVTQALYIHLQSLIRRQTDILSSQAPTIS